MIPLFKVFMAETAAEKVAEVLRSGFIGQGPKVDLFESKLKKWFNNDYIATTNAATSSEHLALHLLKTPHKDWAGLNDGDEVLSSPLTCTASNWPTLANNLKIKWVDIDERNLNIDLDDLERKISPTTKAMMLVHWGGYPIDLDRVKRIQEKTKEMYGFTPMVIEDCAHSIGSTYKGKKIGNHGNFCTFSFQAIKHMTTGDGGIIISPDKDYHTRAKVIRWYGIDRDTNKKDFRCEADIPEWGYKFHMNDIAAAIGLENLNHVDDIISKHRSNAGFYDKELSGVSGLELLERNEDRESSFWIYSMLVENKNGFMKWMKECNVMVSQVHERNDGHTCVKNFKTHLPSLDKITPRLISIPVGWWVEEEQRQHIVDCIKKGW